MAGEMAGVDSTATLQGRSVRTDEAQDQCRGASLQRWEPTADGNARQEQKSA